MQKDGATLRQHLEAVWKATRRKPAELDVPELPSCAAPLWQTWQQLCVARGSNGFGPYPVGWNDLDAWQRVSGQRLTAWEAETITQLDRAARAVLARD